MPSEERRPGSLSREASGEKGVGWFRDGHPPNSHAASTEQSGPPRTASSSLISAKQEHPALSVNIVNLNVVGYIVLFLCDL